jgi:hypothetical protein
MNGGSGSSGESYGIMGRVWGICFVESKTRPAYRLAYTLSRSKISLPTEARGRGKEESRSEAMAGQNNTCKEVIWQVSSDFWRVNTGSASRSIAAWPVVIGGRS